MERKEIFLQELCPLGSLKCNESSEIKNFNAFNVILVVTGLMIILLELKSILEINQKKKRKRTRNKRI